MQAITGLGKAIREGLQQKTRYQTSIQVRSIEISFTPSDRAGPCPSTDHCSCPAAPRLIQSLAVQSVGQFASCQMRPSDRHQRRTSALPRAGSQRRTRCGGRQVSCRIGLRTKVDVPDHRWQRRQRRHAEHVRWACPLHFAHAHG